MKHDVTEAAEQEFGRERLKIYRSSFVPLYHAMTQRKVKSHVKLICLLPDEKVSASVLEKIFG